MIIILIYKIGTPCPAHLAWLRVSLTEIGKLSTWAPTGCYRAAQIARQHAHRQTSSRKPRINPATRQKMSQLSFSDAEYGGKR